MPEFSSGAWDVGARGYSAMCWRRYLKVERYSSGDFQVILSEDTPAPDLHRSR